MSPRTCPNTKCKYDEQLQPGQRCPLCGKEAEEIKFNEFGNLLKKKNEFKKSVKTPKEHARTGNVGTKVHLVEIHPKDIAILLILAVLYFFLSLFSQFTISLSENVNFVMPWANILIPLAIVFGWPAIFGLTLGSLAVILYYNPFYNPFWYEENVLVFAIFLTSFIAWRVGRLKIGFRVNVVAVFGAICGLVALALPWWSFSAWILGQRMVDFTVYPGWFAGNLGLWIDVIGRILGFFVTDPISSLLNNLTLTFWLLGSGSIIALIGAFLRGLKGRIVITVSLVACSVGIFSFYSSLSQMLSTLPMPVTGSEEFSWAGESLASANWGWATGIYLSFAAVVFLVFAILIHNHMIEIKPTKLLACTAATFTFTGFSTLGLILVDIDSPSWNLTATDILLYFLAGMLLSFFAFNIIGYAIVSLFGKRRQEG